MSTRRYRHHKFTWSKPFGSVRLQWELLGPLGGLHFTATKYRDQEWSCGLEFHHTRASNYAPGEAPHHIKCWLTGEPCWHDGTSLYASETLWPMIEAMWLGDADHDAIFRLLEGEADRQFARHVVDTEAKAPDHRKEAGE